MAQMRVFVSHSHEDDRFCRAVVAGLRGAGADVWYDEHNMGAGQLIETIERELRARPVFVLVLSPAALRSHWVRDETKWAYLRYKRDQTRIMLPLLAQVLPDEDEIWLFLQDFKRIEAADLKPYPTAKAVRQLLHMLALTPAGEVPTPVTPQPSESADGLLERGRALIVQKRFTDALLLIDRALSLDSSSAVAWNAKGAALYFLKRTEEALEACDSALALDPTLATAWSNKAVFLRSQGLYDEALGAFNHALALDPAFAGAWIGRGDTLHRLERYEEALTSYDQGLSLDETPAGWRRKATALSKLGRTTEAKAAERRAKELGG